LVEEYNLELTKYKQAKANGNVGIFLIIVGCVCGLISLSFSTIFAFVVILALGLLGYAVYYASKKVLEPQMKSAVRIMITGNHRDFTFNKANLNAVDVANFVVQVENTLSAYQRN
jgi:hypothetical protein